MFDIDGIDERALIELAGATATAGSPWTAAQSARQIRNASKRAELLLQCSKAAHATEMAMRRAVDRAVAAGCQIEAPLLERTTPLELVTQSLEARPSAEAFAERAFYWLEVDMVEKAWDDYCASRLLRPSREVVEGMRMCLDLMGQNRPDVFDKFGLSNMDQYPPMTQDDVDAWQGENVGPAGWKSHECGVDLYCWEQSAPDQMAAALDSIPIMRRLFVAVDMLMAAAESGVDDFATLRPLIDVIMDCAPLTDISEFPDYAMAFKAVRTSQEILPVMERAWILSLLGTEMRRDGIDSTLTKWRCGEFAGAFKDRASLSVLATATLPACPEDVLAAVLLSGDGLLRSRILRVNRGA